MGILRTLAAVASMAVMLALATGAGAEFYKYKDETGQVHFVDDVSQIPPQYREGTDQYGHKQQELPAKVVQSLGSYGMGKRAMVQATLRHKGYSAQVWCVVEFDWKTDPRGRELPGGRHVKGVSPFRETMVDGSCKKLLNLKQEDMRPYDLELGSMTLHGELCEIESIEVGNTRKEKCPVVFLDDEDPETSGILGSSFLDDFSHRVDYDRQVVVWGN